ncbi:MAG: hypothetical protein Q4G33_15225, partial [bacterium]|nr:hypothetical protein [bacterium]
TIGNKAYQQAKNTSGISRAAFDAVRKQQERKKKNPFMHFSSMYSFPKVQKEIALRPQKTFKARQEMNNKYGIDTDSFNIKDFEQWAKKYGVAYDSTFNKIDEGFSHKITENGFEPVSKETLEDAHKLLVLAQNNTNLNMSAAAVAAIHANDAFTFGLSTKISDSALRDYSRKNHNNELLYAPTATGAEYMALNREKHPTAAFIGETGGTLASMAATAAVGGAVAGAGRLAAAPAWVRSAVSQGVSFAVNEGLQTAGHGGSAKDVVINSARAGLAGAVGGGVQAKIGSATRNVLFDKGLQNKIAPEIARNAIASASDAAAQSGVNFLLYSKDNKPTLEETTKNVLVAFAFGAIYSAKDTIKLSKRSKIQLDNLTDKVNADYQALVQKANKNYSKSGEFNSELASLSGNIEEYSRAVRDYLDGYGYYGKIDGHLVDLEPGARFVGQEKQVKAMRDSLDTIISRTQEIRSAASKFGQLKLGSGSVTSAADDAFRAGLSHSSAVRGYNFTKRLARNTGTDVNISKRVFVPGTRDEVNGFANVADNKIALSRNADFGMTPAQVAAHEGGHIAAAKAPEEFGEYNKTALDAAMRNNKDLFGKHIESLKARGYSPEQIDEEIAAELTAPFADSQAVINALAKDTPQMARTGLKMISRIKATLKDLSGNSYTTPNGLKLTFRDIDEMGVKYARAINAAGRIDEKYTDKVNNNVRYSVKTDANGDTYIEIDEDILNGVPEQDWGKVTKEHLRKFSNGIPYNNEIVQVSSKSRGKFTHSRYNNSLTLDDKADKFRMANNIDEIVQNQINTNLEDLHHERKDNIVHFTRGNSIIKVGDHEFIGDVLIGITDTGEKLLYDIVDLQHTKIQNHHLPGRNKAVSVTLDDDSVSDNRISQSNTNVNTYGENNSDIRESRKNNYVAL